MHRWGSQRYVCAEWNRQRREQMTEAQRERIRETARERYYDLDGVSYNRFLLKCRRNKALARMRRRGVAA